MKNCSVFTLSLDLLFKSNLLADYIIGCTLLEPMFL